MIDIIDSCREGKRGNLFISFWVGSCPTPRNACNSKIPSSRMFRNKTWHNFGTKIDLKLIDNDQVAGFYLPGYPCEDIMDLPASVIGSTSQIN